MNPLDHVAQFSPILEALLRYAVAFTALICADRMRRSGYRSVPALLTLLATLYLVRGATTPTAPSLTWHGAAINVTLAAIFASLTLLWAAKERHDHDQ